MKRIITLLITIGVALGIFAVPASANTAVPMLRGCALTEGYFPAEGNGLTWSDSKQAYQTPPLRSGDCGYGYVINLGVSNAPPCTMMRMDTYNDDWTLRVRGQWWRFDRLYRVGDLRGGDGLDFERWYRVFAFGCNFRSHGLYVPGFEVYTH